MGISNYITYRQMHIGNARYKDTDKERVHERVCESKITYGIEE
jgi:hypothetical protein